MKNNIFKYISCNQNDLFSKFTKSELDNLFAYILNYKLEYRKHINLDKYSSFGLEIEFKSMVNDIYLPDEFKEFRKWTLEKECFVDGYEFISPILFDKDKTWRELDLVCSTISDYGKINSKCGAHIHIGTQVMGTKDVTWINFIKLWSIFEPIILKFTDGEYSFHRPFMDEYATIVREQFLYLYQRYLEDGQFFVEKFIQDSFCNRKSTAINFNNVAYDKSFKKNNTIEFRSPNGTLNKVVWQNNVNLLVKLLECCRRNNFDSEYLEKLYLKKSKVYYFYNDYSKFYIDLAIDFADIVFDNNLDKVYFLRQYLKDYPNVCTNYKKVKKFTE